jgi:LPXTG-motif cell wall-anchored protein
MRTARCLLLALLPMAGCGVGDRQDERSSQAPARAIERTAEKGPVKLVVRLWPREPRLSDLLHMEVQVEFPAGIEVKPPAFGQAVGDFLIRDYSELFRAPENRAPALRRFQYELEPAHAGKHLIHSVAIEFSDKRPGAAHSGEPTLVETEPLEVNVTSDLGSKAPDLAQLQPMVPPRGVPQTGALAWIAAIAVVGVLAVLGYWVLRRRRRRPVEPRRQTPEEIAHAALALLLAEDLPARGLVKEFYLRLTGIVRQYVEDTTGIRAPEQTTEEFLRDIRSRAVFPPDRSVRLADFLESADLVKYAGQMPGEGQIDQAIARAREFVNLAPAPVPAAVAVAD